jgi:hypothetical protein
MAKGKADARYVKVSLDIGAETNVISPRLAEELGCPKTDHKEPQIRWGSGTTAFCYGAY